MAAIISCVPMASATAGMEFWLENDSSLETQAIVEQIPGINFLRAGQKGRTYAEGRWGRAGDGCWSSCSDETLANPYRVRFEHITGNGTKYCEWKVSYEVTDGAGTSWGHVDIKVDLEYEAPGMRCTSAGMRDVRYHSTARDVSAYVTFNVNDN